MPSVLNTDWPLYTITAGSILFNIRGVNCYYPISKAIFVHLEQDNTKMVYFRPYPDHLE